MEKTYHPIDSLTGGFIKGYPKTIYMAEYTLRNWATLNMANQSNGEKGISDVLTGVLDNAIDFERTGLIKTSDDLTIHDRKKLFFWQKIQTDKSEFTITYKCPKDGKEIEQEYDILKFKETYIKKPPTRTSFKLKNGKTVELAPFTRRSLNEYDKILINFQENGSDTEFLRIIKDESGEFKILANNYTEHLLEIYPVIKSIEGEEAVLADIGMYVDYVYDNFNKKEISFIEDYIVDIYHDISQEAEIRCECGFTSIEDAPSNLGFFLGIN